jgi:hypothetical protein
MTAGLGNTKAEVVRDQLQSLRRDPVELQRLAAVVDVAVDNHPVAAGRQHRHVVADLFVVAFMRRLAVGDVDDDDNRQTAVRPVAGYLAP